MPEVLKFKDNPGFFNEFGIEPFREEFIPGSIVLSMEKRNDGKVFFQIPTPIYSKLDQTQLEVLKRKVHEWWLSIGEAG